MKEDIVNVTVDRGGHQIFRFSDKCQIKSIKPLSNKTLEIEVKNKTTGKI